jgi:hypothetical protein
VNILENGDGTTLIFDLDSNNLNLSKYQPLLSLGDKLTITGV